MLSMLRDAEARATQVHDFTDFVRAAGCIMCSKGLGDAAGLAEAKGWKRVRHSPRRRLLAALLVPRAWA